MARCQNRVWGVLLAVLGKEESFVLGGGAAGVVGVGFGGCGV